MIEKLKLKQIILIPNSYAYGLDIAMILSSNSALSIIDFDFTRVL